MNEFEIMDAAIEAAHPWANLQITSLLSSQSKHWCNALMELELNSNSKAFMVSAIKNLSMPALRSWINKTPTDRSSLLLVAPYISEEMAQMCVDLGINFVDTAGNVYINHPEKLIYISGKSAKNSIRDSLKTGKSALATRTGQRIIFSLLTEPDLVRQGYREIAKHSSVALGSVGKVLNELEASGHLVKGKRLIGKEELVRSWAAYYCGILRPQLNPTRYTLVGEVSSKYTPWRSIKLKHGDAAWGGEEGAYLLQKYLQPASATFYCWANRMTMMVKYRLKPDKDGPIEILDAFWELKADKQMVVPPLLIYADLINSRDSRNHEAAEQLLPLVLQE